jgi:ribose/xylose/arabinose/galactoside ABC-type transport system permease subunit
MSTDTGAVQMGKRIGKILSLFGPFLGLLFVYLIFLKAPPSFHTLYNTKTILQQAVIIGIAALGMTLVIISAGIDLSVGSLVALGTVVTALVLKKWGAGEMGIWLPLAAAFAGILSCAFCGFLNGLMITRLRIVPFIVTLGMMQIARGLALGLSGQWTVNVDRSWLTNMMVVEPRMGVWNSVAPGVWLMLVLLVVMFVVLRYTVFGRHVYAVGSNEATARLCGIRVRVNRVCVYTICGIMAGIASVMAFSVLNVGDPTGAVGFELDVIAAVVIGGGSFSGGEGSVVGSIAGALIIAVLRNGCQAVGLDNYVQNLVIGAIIIIAVGLDQLKRARRA